MDRRSFAPEDCTGTQRNRSAQELGGQNSPPSHFAFAFERALYFLNPAAARLWRKTTHQLRSGRERKAHQ